MASAVQVGMRTARTSSPKKVQLSREQEILQEFQSFIDSDLDAMTPAQLKEYERKADEIMKQARLR